MPSIYALRNRTSDDVYYGSTKTPINHRFNRHKYLARQYEADKTKTKGSAYEVVRCETAYIELVEEVSEEEMLVRERWWVENHPCVNKQLPFLTTDEHKAYRKEWLNAHPQNKEVYMERQRERRRTTISSCDKSRR